MTAWLSAGILFTFFSIACILFKWGNIRCIGVTPVSTFTFIAILFTSGLDVGLIMFPLTEFAGYADLTTSPEYAFTNPLAIEFGFWAFLIWGFYFLTCFYFCIIEPKVQFFSIPIIKFINNVVIIGTCAFTAYLLLSNLPWYIPQLADDGALTASFYFIVFVVIATSVYSSTDIRYVRWLSLGSTWLFFALIVLMWASILLAEKSTTKEILQTFSLLNGYFSNIHKFVLPLNAYHEFYLYWWFAWSIMIGQFTARFVGGLRTYQVFLAMLIFPSIPIAIWFVGLYYYHLNALHIATWLNTLMVAVGILFVVNSLDSLIRLYTDNLNLSVSRLGKAPYFVGNLLALSGLTLLFTLDFLQIQWVGTIVIGLLFSCLLFILVTRSQLVKNISSSPDQNGLNFTEMEDSHRNTSDTAIQPPNKPTKSHISTTELAHVDLNLAMSHSNNDMCLVIKLMAIFRKSHEHEILLFEQAIVTNSHSEILGIAHKIAGSAEYVGAKTLGNLARKYESFEGDTGSEAHLNSLQNLNDALKGVMHDLDSLIEAHKQ